VTNPEIKPLYLKMGTASVLGFPDTAPKPPMKSHDDMMGFAMSNECIKLSCLSDADMNRGYHVGAKQSVEHV